MLKYSALFLSLFLYLPGCAEEPLAPAPTGGTQRPVPSQNCRDACENLLTECTTGEPSLSVGQCQDDCKASLLSEDEVRCLNTLVCGEASDHCLGD